jgi:hypothetical protein
VPGDTEVLLDEVLADIEVRVRVLQARPEDGRLGDRVDEARRPSLSAPALSGRLPVLGSFSGGRCRN